MRSAVVFVTCLCLLGMNMPRAACQDAPVEPSPVEPAPSPAEQPAMPTLPPALGVDLANVLLGECEPGGPPAGNRVHGGAAAASASLAAVDSPRRF